MLARKASPVLVGEGRNSAAAVLGLASTPAYPMGAEVAVDGSVPIGAYTGVPSVLGAVWKSGRFDFGECMIRVATRVTATRVTGAQLRNRETPTNLEVTGAHAVFPWVKVAVRSLGRLHVPPTLMDVGSSCDVAGAFEVELWAPPDFKEYSSHRPDIEDESEYEIGLVNIEPEPCPSGEPHATLSWHLTLAAGTPDAGRVTVVPYGAHECRISGNLAQPVQLLQQPPAAQSVADYVNTAQGIAFAPGNASYLYLPAGGVAPARASIMWSLR